MKDINFIDFFWVGFFSINCMDTFKSHTTNVIKLSILSICQNLVYSYDNDF